MSGFRSLLRFSHAANAARIASTQRAYSVEIRRIATEDPRMSGAVVHGDMVYLSGQVPAGGPEEWGKASIGEQVETTLAKVDVLLEAAGTDKSKILSAQIWVKNMSDFAAMNEKWIEWIGISVTFTFLIFFESTVHLVTV